jgi:hypothetical protein
LLEEGNQIDGVGAKPIMIKRTGYNIIEGMSITKKGLIP